MDLPYKGMSECIGLSVKNQVKDLIFLFSEDRSLKILLSDREKLLQ